MPRICELLNRNYSVYSYVNFVIFLLATSHLVVALTLEWESLEKSVCVERIVLFFRSSNKLLSIWYILGLANVCISLIPSSIFLKGLICTLHVLPFFKKKNKTKT